MNRFPPPPALNPSASTSRRSQAGTSSLLRSRASYAATAAEEDVIEVLTIDEDEPSPAAQASARGLRSIPGGAAPSGALPPTLRVVTSTADDADALGREMVRRFFERMEAAAFRSDPDQGVDMRPWPQKPVAAFFKAMAQRTPKLNAQGRAAVAEVVSFDTAFSGFAWD